MHISLAVTVLVLLLRRLPDRVRIGQWVQIGEEVEPLAHVLALGLFPLGLLGRVDLLLDGRGTGRTRHREVLEDVVV